jgi:hypothetical protein
MKTKDKKQQGIPFLRRSCQILSITHGKDSPLVVSLQQYLEEEAQKNPGP